MKLYEIKGQYLKLLNKIENGEVPEEFIKDTLESIEGEFEDKINSIACFIKSLEADITALKSESDNLKQRAETKAKKVANLKQYIFESMKQLDKQKIETAQNVISVKKNPPKVQVSENFVEWAKNDGLFNFLVTHKEEFVPDKNAIKDLLKKGQEIPYCQLVQDESLKIK